MKIELKPIDDRNKSQCITLKVTADQMQYIASNKDSLEEASLNVGIARPFAIYIDGTIVGFTMFAFDEENDDPCDKYCLWRFMIDESLQGKGYGSAALKEIIRYFKENDADQITLSTKESNTAALGLYHKFGFKENGQMSEDEIVLKLHLK